MKFKEIPEIKEVSKEEIRALGREVYSIQAILETLSVALYNVSDEPEPLLKATTMSFVAEDVAKRCSVIVEKLYEVEEKLN